MLPTMPNWLEMQPLKIHNNELAFKRLNFKDKIIKDFVFTLKVGEHRVENPDFQNYVNFKK